MQPAMLLTDSLAVKAAHLDRLLLQMGSVLVAFSGGVDSSFLAAQAARILGKRALAVTAVSETFPSWDRLAAERIARVRGIRHLLIETSELKLEGFAMNPADRCYHCKRHLFGKLREIAAREGLAFVADATTADDLSDYRPGRRAAKECGIRSPLLEAALSKDDIRHLSRAIGLEGWDRPASACLASRFPYGERITAQLLLRVEQAETALRAMGFATVRVRCLGSCARVELAPDALEDALCRRKEIVGALKDAGFVHVALDLEGYRTGSMNESLALAQVRSD